MLVYILVCTVHVWRADTKFCQYDVTLLLLVIRAHMCIGFLLTTERLNAIIWMF